MTRYDYTDDIQAVFDHWQSKKKLKNKWKGSNGLMPHHKREIRNYLKEGYTLDNIKEAIDNYALILLDPRYKWTHAWNLFQFLTRKQPKDGTKQFYRFVGDFNHLDWMKDWAKREFANPSIKPQVQELCNQVGKKIPALSKSRCAQRKDIDRLKQSRWAFDRRLEARKKAKGK